MSFKKFVIGFDPHGSEQDKKSNDVFFKFIEIWKPDYRIVGGDIWDMRPLRRKATEDEKRESMREDFQAGKEWVERLKPTHGVYGNHDARIFELAEKDDGIRSDYAKQLICEEIEPLFKKFNCRMLPYHKRYGVLRIGHLKVVHGFYCGMYASKQHALVYGNVLHGHTHSIEQFSIAGLERRVGRACGALCNLNMEYNERQPNTLRQANGFPFGVINDKTGDYVSWQAEAINGHWIIPSDIVEL